MEEWKKKAIERVEKSAQADIEGFERYIKQTKAVSEVATKLILASDIPISPALEPICREVHLFGADNKLAHHIAKIVGVPLKKQFQSWDGTMKYTAKVDDVEIEIHDVKDIPRCTITKETKTAEVTRYEIQCNGFYREPKETTQK